MYLDFEVEIPSVSNKITYRKKNGKCYVYYEYDRIYDPQKQYTAVKRTMIGRRSEIDPSMLVPNQNFLKYFPDVELPEERQRSARSSCLRVGTNIVLQKLIRESGVKTILQKYFKEKDLELLLDLASYSIIMESNVAQYYPDYAYNHAIYTEGMKIYSDSKVSDFFKSITDEQTIGFLNSWNEIKDHREKIYVSYDSTNKSCQAGDLDIVEYGHAKVEQGAPIFNYSIAYDTKNQVPLYYEAYPGSLNDMSQLQFMIDRASGYGYKKIGFILDRGYFSKKNLDYMEEYGYSFVIMLKGMKSLVKELVLEVQGSFEKRRLNFIDEYKVHGITVSRRLYATDERDRYIHIYHSREKENAECCQIEAKLSQMRKFMQMHTNELREFGPAFNKYFELLYDKEEKKFMVPIERTTVIDDEMRLCGYFCIITSEKMTAEEAIHLYKSRDVSEKLFLGDKSFLGNNCLRVSTDEAASAKIFIEFIALILRCRLYTELKEMKKELDKSPNYMTVPAAIKELEKIEMVRQLDTVYRLDHGVTAKQKNILKAFGMDAEYIKYMTQKISDKLKAATTVKKEEEDNGKNCENEYSGTED